MKFVIQNTDLVKEHQTILACYNEIVYLTHNFTIVCQNSPEFLDKICIFGYYITFSFTKFHFRVRNFIFVYEISFSCTKFHFGLSNFFCNFGLRKSIFVYEISFSCTKFHFGLPIFFGNFGLRNMYFGLPNLDFEYQIQIS